MLSPLRRKTFMLLALAASLALALIAIVIDADLRDRLGNTYWIVSLAIAGSILLIVTGYAWDRALAQRLAEMKHTAGGDTRDPFTPIEEESEADEIMGLARQIERMAKSLQKIEASYRGMVEDQADLICRYRADGRLTFVNGAYATFMGVKRGDLIGQRFPINDFGYPRNASKSLPDAATFEAEVADASGKTISLLWTNRAIRDHDGELLEYQAVGHDISLRKQAEDALMNAKVAAESADRAKSEFLSVVSHEIRTPINGVLGFAKLLRDTPLNADQREFVEMIENSGHALSMLINDILDLSQMEAGKLAIYHAPFPLRDCVQDVVNHFAPRAHAAALTLDLKIDPTVPAMVNGDAHRVRQVLGNLLGNALKFTERGGVTVSVSCIRGENVPGTTYRQVRVFVDVADTGIGIPADKLDQLFKPFSQIDTTARRRRGGTGLGLVISKRLCELMGGAISVDSTPGEGSSFRFSLQMDYDKGDSRPPLPQGRPANSANLSADTGRA
jgi:PAS domain S-box-containing protein